MMVVLSAGKAVLAAVAATLATSSVVNISQTARIMQDSMSVSPLSSRDLKNIQDGVSVLQTMSREELLRVYIASEEPPNTLDVLEGEWDGLLLNNNGPIMTSVSIFLTNFLFGRGREWNGKGFSNNAGRTSTRRLGFNRFHGQERREDNHIPSDEKGKECSAKAGSSMMERQHTFEYGLDNSRLDSSRKSIVLQYSNHQGPLSLWKTMSDELRIIRIPGEDSILMIGFGSMAWSGGHWNASPFCLWKSDEGTSL
jgi:hypothetical protein